MSDHDHADGVGEPIRCCPECGDSHIARRHPEHPCSRADGTEERWRCKNCTTTFKTPDERPREQGRGRSPEGTVARLLEDADPEALLQ